METTLAADYPQPPAALATSFQSRTNDLGPSSRLYRYYALLTRLPSPPGAPSPSSTPFNFWAALSMSIISIFKQAALGSNRNITGNGLSVYYDLGNPANSYRRQELVPGRRRLLSGARFPSPRESGWASASRPWLARRQRHLEASMIKVNKNTHYSLALLSVGGEALATPCLTAVNKTSSVPYV